MVADVIAHNFPSSDLDLPFSFLAGLQVIFPSFVNLQE